MEQEPTTRQQQKKGLAYRLTFFKRQWFRTWLFMMLISALMLAVMLTTGNVAVAPAALIYAAAAAPLAFAMATHVRTGIGSSVPAGTLLATFLFGGGIALTVGGFLDAELVGDRGVAMWPVGLVEELAKFLPVLAIALTGRYLTERAGVALGLATAMGFAILESVWYGLGSGDITAGEITLLLRGITTPFSHMAWTGLLCAVAFAAWEKRGKVVLTPMILGAYALVALLHSANDMVAEFADPIEVLAFFAIAVTSYVLFRLATRSLTLQPGETTANVVTSPAAVPEQRPGDPAQEPAPRTRS